MMNNKMNNKTTITKTTFESSPYPLKCLTGNIGIFHKTTDNKIIKSKADNCTVVSARSIDLKIAVNNPVGYLQELAVANKWRMPKYEFLGQQSSSSTKAPFIVTHEFSIECEVENVKQIGTGQTKKLAKHNAAYKVLETISMSRNDVNDLVNNLSMNDGKSRTLQDIIHHVGISQNKIVEQQQCKNTIQSDCNTLESFNSILDVIKRIAALKKLENSTSRKEIEDLIATLSIDEDAKMYAQSSKNKNNKIDESKFDYMAYHPKQRKDLILKELYSDYCIYFYQGDYGNCMSIINQSKRDIYMKHKRRNQNRKKQRDNKLYCQVLSQICAPFQAGNRANQIMDQINEEDIVTRVGEAVDGISNLSEQTQNTFSRVDKVLDSFSDSNLINKASQLTDNIELLCKKTTSAVDKASSIFDQVMKFLEPSEQFTQKAIIITSATKLFASCDFSVANLFAYFACICATFNITSNFFATQYAHFKSLLENKFHCQSSDEDTDSEEVLSLLASITQTLATIMHVPITSQDIVRKLSDFGRAATGGEKIYKIFNSIFSWIRDKYFKYTYGISYDQYKMQVKFPELTKLAECCLLIGQASNDEIDSTKSLCEVILETDKLAHEMSMSTLKESDASRYIATLRATIKPAVARAMKAPVMNKPSRRKPFAIYLYGKAGTGKTNLTDIIRASLYKKYYAGQHEQGWEHSSFSRKTENEYWEGYYNQPMCVYDDIFQLHDSRDKPNAEMMEIIRVINDDDCQLHMATLEDKAGKFFTSDFVICTSNVRIPACHSIACPSAVYRRFDVCVDVEVDPAFGKRLTDREGTYLGIDDTKVSHVVDTNVYALSTYNMNSPNGGEKIPHIKNENKNSFEVFMDYLISKIDEHRAGNIDRQSHLRALAGEVPLPDTNAGLARARQIELAQRTIPSARAIKSMSKAPFVPTTENMEAQSSVKYTVENESVEIKIEEALTWRQRLLLTRKKIESVIESICHKVKDTTHAVSVFDFPRPNISDRFTIIKDKVANFINTINKQLNLKEMIDYTFENVSSILLGITSIMSVIMTGVYINKKHTKSHISCPLMNIATIEELTIGTECVCSDCKLLRPYVSRLDKFDDKRKISNHLYHTLKMLSRNDELLNHLTTLIEAERKMSDLRENDLSRKMMLLQKEQTLTESDFKRHGGLLDRVRNVDARKTCELSSGDNVTRKNVSSLISEISSGDNKTRGKSTNLISEISSGDNITRTKSKQMISEISSGDNVTLKNTKNNMISENLDRKISDLIRKAEEEAVECTDAIYDAFEEGTGNITPDANASLMTCQGFVNKDQCFQEQYNKCISRNCVRVSCCIQYKNETHTTSVNGVFILGRILLIPHHMYWSILKEEKQEFMIRNPFRSMCSTFTLKECTVMQLKDKNGQPLDCVMMAMPLRVPSYPSILNMLTDANELNKVIEGDSILVGLREITIKGNQLLTLTNHHIKDARIALQKNHYLKDDEELTYTTAVASMYNAATAPGDCGSLLFSRNTNMKGRIISFHIAGNNREGMGLIISKEMMTRNLNEFNKIVTDDRKFIKGSFNCQMADDFIHVNPLLSYVGLDVPGDYLSVGISKSLPHPVKTELNPSLIHSMIYETESKPAYLKPTIIDDKLVDPLKKGICKAFTIQPKLDNTILDIAANDVFNQFVHTDEDLTRILTYEETIKGVEGYEYANSLNRISSAGFPWVFNKNSSTGKREWLGQGDEWDCTNVELKNAVDRIINNAKNNQRSEVVFVSTLKDERRPIAKVEQGKTRVFEAGPMDYTMAVRKYFLGFIESVMRNRITNEVCVGTNVYSNDWNKLGIKLSRYGRYVIAGDFSNFDGSLHQEILWKICDIINKWYNDGEENARIRNVLFEEIVNSVVSVDGILLQKTHAQPSGNPLTVIINSVFNQIVMRMAYLLAKREQELPLMCDFTDHVSMATYGDDNVLNISPTVIEWYNQVTITKHLSTFGLTYTDEAKSGQCVPYRSLQDVNFLKRKFVKNESGIFTAPLLIETVRDMCNWVRGKQIRSATQENVQNALLEFALHGKKQYEYEVVLLTEAFKKVGLPLRFPLYEEFESFFALQRKQ